MIPIESTQIVLSHSVDIWMLDVFRDFYGFVTMVVTAAGALGALGGRSMAVGALGAYLVFVQFAISTNDQLLVNLLYVTLTLVIVGMSWKMWRLEGGGAGE